MKSMAFALAGAAAFAVGLATPAPAQKAERAISLFQFDGASGYAPQGGVITDRHGTVFGTTTIGGNGPCLGDAGCGTVFALSPPQAGSTQWIFDKLYDFQGGRDGGFPVTQLTLGPAGTIYGYNEDGTPGTVFRLLPPATPGGKWTFQILYVFTGKADGNLSTAYSPLILHHGALYGIADGGASTECGQFGCGSVFRLTPGAPGKPWAETTLFKFVGKATSGEPNWIAGFNAAGSLYVSTSLGHGAVAEISPTAGGGAWTERVITRFEGGSDGKNPTSLVLAPDGTLYGIAATRRTGLAFQLTPPGDGGSAWTRTTIATISVHGYGPNSLAPGAGATLIGTVQGDVDFYPGSVFQLTAPADGGAWTYTQLWSFDRGPDRNPLNVVTGRGGNLFGVLSGGDSTNGSLFELH